MHFRALRGLMRGILDSGISLELISAPGRGKSSFVEDTVAAMSKLDVAQGRQPWGFAKMFLATQTPPDLIGYIMKGEKVIDGITVPVSEPTMPGWMFTVDGHSVSKFERGILFLDEYGQGETDVKRASAELFLNRQLGPWRLGRGWSVIAASNRTSDRSGVTKSLDFVINRRLQINVTDDLESWEEWAFAHDVDPTIITFANQNPHIVFTEGVPEKQGPWCTPRSLVMAANLLGNMRSADGHLPVTPDAKELACGIIGDAATAQMFAMIQLGMEMPPLEMILKDPDGTKIPGKPDACMLVCYNLAARVSEDNANAVVTYMARMPKEFAITFAKSACRRNPQLIFAPAFEKWATQNSSLMAQLVDSK